MSGSDYVWLLVRDTGSTCPKPFAAWTTKYELCYWLQHNDFREMTGYRIRAGTWHKKEPVLLDLEAVRDGTA